MAGDRAAVRVRFRGLHVAPYAGLEPSGRTIQWDELHVWRLEGGRVTEHWASQDERWHA